MNGNIPLLIVGLAVCAAGGYFAGRSSRTVPQPQPASTVTSAAAALNPAVPPGPGAKSSGPGDPLEERLILLTKLESGGVAVARSLFTTSLAEKDTATLEAAAQRWAELAPESLLDHLLGLEIEEPWLLHQAKDILLREWARRDPSAALKAAGRLENSPGFTSWGRNPGKVLAEVMQRDPVLALTLAEAHPDPLPMGWIGKSWDADPARFLQATVGLNASNRLLMAAVMPQRQEALKAWHRNDPGAAMAWVKSLKAPLQIELMPVVVGPLTTADLPAALALIQQLEGPVQNSLLPMIVEKMAVTDLPGALTLFEKMEPSMARETSGTRLAKAWAASDPSASLQWIHDHLKIGRNEAFPGWAGAIPAGQLPAAAAMVHALPEGSSRDMAFNAVVMVWSKNDLPDALDWVRSLQTASQRRHGFDTLLEHWNSKDPVGVRDFISKADPAELPGAFYYRLGTDGTLAQKQEQILWAATLPPDRRDKLFDFTTSNFLANQSTEEGITLMNRIAEPELQRKAGSLLFRQLFQKSPQAAAQFLEDLPAGFFDEPSRSDLTRMVDANITLTREEKEALTGRLR